MGQAYSYFGLFKNSSKISKKCGLTLLKLAPVIVILLPSEYYTHHNLKNILVFLVLTQYSYVEEQSTSVELTKHQKKQ